MLPVALAPNLLLAVISPLVHYNISKGDWPPLEGLRVTKRVEEHISVWVPVPEIPVPVVQLRVSYLQVYPGSMT